MYSLLILKNQNFHVWDILKLLVFYYLLMNVLILIGPPAVGKMAVGMKLKEKLSYPLFHNHMTIELLVQIWEHGSPEFLELNSEFRRRVFEVASRSNFLGFTYTAVVDFNLDMEKKFITKFTNIFKNKGHEVFYIELFAELEKRIQRNKTELRITHKPSKKNISWSEEKLIAMESKHKMNSEDGDFIKQKYPDNYLRIDTTDLTVEETSEKIIEHFKL